jgi:hypothetical protein
MSSTTTKGHESSVIDRIKQLYQRLEDSRCSAAEWIPLFCVEARIDFNDVRTGFRETVSLSKALEIYSDNAEMLWTDDMIRDVDLVKAIASAPEGIRLSALPDFVNANFLTRMENQFVQYLLRSFETKIFRNFDLNIYSLSGESRLDFCKRCLDLFTGMKRRELDQQHEVFNRKLEQVKQKYIGVTDSGELEKARSESRNRDVFSRCSEQMAELFNSAELRLKPLPSPPPISSSMQELEERLLALEWEAHQAITRLADSFEERACAIDEYILHPNLKDIHFVRSCIFWMPQRIA